MQGDKHTLWCMTLHMQKKIMNCMLITRVNIVV